MASAFNRSLYLAVGSAVGVEGRAISNLREHDNKIGDGLTYWAPNANMERDPRWGRNQEAPGEDPHLTSVYIAAYVRGLQEGEDPDHVQVCCHARFADTGDPHSTYLLAASASLLWQMVATCKHFIANSLEHSTIDGKVITRHNFDAEISIPELTDYYMPSFKSCVQEGRALGISASRGAGVAHLRSDRVATALPCLLRLAAPLAPASSPPARSSAPLLPPTPPSRPCLACPLTLPRAPPPCVCSSLFGQCAHTTR